LTFIFITNAGLTQASLILGKHPELILFALDQIRYIECSRRTRTEIAANPFISALLPLVNVVAAHGHRTRRPTPAQVNKIRADFIHLRRARGSWRTVRPLGHNAAGRVEWGGGAIHVDCHHSELILATLPQAVHVNEVVLDKVSVRDPGVLALGAVASLHCVVGDTAAAVTLR